MPVSKLTWAKVVDADHERPLRRREGIYYLTHDENDEYTGGLSVPCSRYGRNGAECAPVAWRLAYVLDRESYGSGVDINTLDYTMSLVVNDHDDVTDIIREYGHRKYT